jgi:Uncharacterized protein, homolog of Cu resistance protein CopC
VVADIPAELPDASDTWKVAYRVVSADGHPISGTISFTVATAAPTSTARQDSVPVTSTTPASTPATSTAGSSHAKPSSKNSVATMLWLPLGAFVLVVAVVAVAVWRSRGNNTTRRGNRDQQTPPRS